MIAIKPHKYQQYGDDTEIHFRVITDVELTPQLSLEGDARYLSQEVISCVDLENIFQVIATIPRPAHILILFRTALFVSPPPELLGKHAKLLVMAAYSTPLDVEDIAYFLSAIEKTDIASQQIWADRFFDTGNHSKCLYFIDEETQTIATFRHLHQDYEWFDQIGVLPWGGQQFCPSGEISCLPLPHGQYHAEHSFDLNGEITLHGIPIINSGLPSFLRSDQERIYQQLSTLIEHPVIAAVSNGVIQNIRCPSIQGKSALAMLEALFTVDSRYTLIWELGFGANTNIKPRPGNKAPNECFGGKNGCIHFGLGLTPWTQYHLDLLSPNTIVQNEHGQCLTGKTSTTTTMLRTRASGCACLT